jgi:hypothetical protein
MDKRVFALGAAMLAVGGLSWYYFSSNIPLGTSGMTEEQTNAFYQAEALNTGITNISQMVFGIGFFIALISMGLKRRKKGGVGKPITQKPTES